MQPKTGSRHRLIQNGCNDSTRNVEPNLNYLFAATLKHCSLVKKCEQLTRHPWQLFNSLKGRCNRRHPEMSHSGGPNPRRNRNCTNQDSAKRRAPYKTLLATAATQTLLKIYSPLGNSMRSHVLLRLVGGKELWKSMRAASSLCLENMVLICFDY